MLKDGLGNRGESFVVVIGMRRKGSFCRAEMGYWQQNPPCAAFLVSARASRQCFEQAMRDHAIQIEAGLFLLSKGALAPFAWRLKPFCRRRR